MPRVWVWTIISVLHYRGNLPDLQETVDRNARRSRDGWLLLTYDEPKDPPFDSFGEDPHMWSYWSDKYYQLEHALEEYYPKTMAGHDELRTLFYIYKATKEKSLANRIHEIMGEREEQWKDAIGYD